MNQVKGRYFLLNGKLEDSNTFEAKTSVFAFKVYEVIRIINGIPLFSEDHFRRMNHSLQQVSQSSFISFPVFEQQLKLLAQKNHFPEGNIKINLEQNGHTMCMYFIPHYYPTALEYQQGVKTGLFQAERNDPHIKASMTELRAKVNQYLEKHHYFEVFYIDRNKMITEGSRSNIFFIKNQTVYTSPAEKVLLGVTRQKVVECLKNLNLELEEQEISKEKINIFDAAFITGTSPKVLPIVSIDEHHYSPQSPITKKIMDEYDRITEEYIRLKQNI